MTQLISTYQQQFKKTINATNNRLDTVSYKGFSQQSQYSQTFSKAKEDLNQCDKCIKYMETQMSSFAPQKKKQYQTKIRKYKRQFDLCKKKLFNVQDKYNFEKNKSQLLQSSTISSEDSTGKEKLIKNGQMLSETNSKLKNSLKDMIQLENMSNGIQMQLKGQTDKLQNNLGKVKGIHQELTQSQIYIRSITNAMRKNKMIVCGVVFFVILIIIVILCLVLAPRFKNS